MKKLLLFTIILGGSIAFTSCSKSSCECTESGITLTITEEEWKDAGGTGNFSDECKESDSCKLV